MRVLALAASIVVTLAAAGCAALLVVPAPTKPLAFLSLVVDEKTWVLVGAALVAAGLARAGRARPWSVAQAILTAVIVALACVPVAQAVSLAARRRVSFEFSRWLAAPLDVGAARPAQTIVYATVDGRPLALDVYRPVEPVAGARVPAVVVIHGGGWSADDKGDAPRASAWLAARGYAVFDVQYRLAPQPNWQTALGDVKCAIGWVKRHARDAGVDVDPDAVTLLGRSAGGHLALLAAYTPDDPALPPSCEAGDTRVAAVISYYGFTDLTWAYANPGNPRVFDTRARVGNFLGGTPATVPERYRLMSPTERATARAPRTLLVHGGRDRFVDVAHVELLASRLRALGVPHDVLVVPYAQHAFDFVAGGLGGQLAENSVLRILRSPPRATGPSPTSSPIPSPTPSPTP
ncbi:MAG: alpha/beta hydrolase [Myxococcales bacterium]|nr:alpha/beta hydrolase [Myxococcales bacterium]